ncbi:MAG: helix-turn-helix transcriptional regulator [Clostridia bacterium]|nr:helix-turn-helix transcriptional regulator [Clostridia bacterium]
MSYNELKQRGTYDLPVELYEIDINHPKYEMAYHWHSEFEIVRIISGTLKIHLNRRELTATAGDVIFVNSETVHGAMPEDCVYECIVMSNELLKAEDKLCGGFLSELLDHVIVVNDHFRESDGRVFSAANSLFEVMKSNGCYFEVLGALYTFFGIIASERLYKSSAGFSESDTVGNTKLKKALLFMRKNYASQLTLEEIASVAGMSPKYFCYFFKEMTQKSPVSYLNSYRVERAARKLLATDASVTDIAYGCGFNDLSYFIKTFKAVKGITPNSFRKNGE